MTVEKVLTVRDLRDLLNNFDENDTLLDMEVWVADNQNGFPVVTTETSLQQFWFVGPTLYYST